MSSTGTQTGGAAAAALLAAEMKTLNLTLGSLEVGLLFSTMLFGVVTLQTYNYFCKFPEDSRLMKIMVVVIWFLELSHLVCLCVSFYTATIIYYGRLQDLLKWPALTASLLPSSWVGIIAQIFFAGRVYMFSRSMLIPIMSWFLCWVRFSFNLASTILGFRAASLEGFMSQYDWMFTVILTMSAVIDLMLAIALSYSLSQHKEKGMPVGSGRVLDNLIKWSIRNGLMTSLADISVLICFQTMPHNFVFIAIYSVVARLYSISLLSSLNARSRLRKTIALGDSIQLDSSGRTSSEPRQFSSPIVIETTHTTHVSTSDMMYFERDDQQKSSVGVDGFQRTSFSRTHPV